MNIDKMRDDLKGLPDQALVGYVQNPGQVPAYLALSELQRRKAMRQQYQAQAAQGQEQQPSVAEQLTTPEQPQGLAALPVENVGSEEAYAQGGIIAFAEGGDPYWNEQKRASKERDLYWNFLKDVSNLQTSAARDALGTLGTVGIADMRLVRHPETGKLVPMHEVQGWLPRVREALGMENTKQAATEYQQEYPGPTPSLTRTPIKQLAEQEIAATKPAAVPGQVEFPNFAKDMAESNAIQIRRKIAEGVYPDPNKPVAPVAPPKQTGGRSNRTGTGNAVRAAAPAGGVADLLTYKEMPFDESAYAPDPEIGAKGHMQEYRDMIGEDPGRADLAKRMSDLEGRAKESERQAPWMALANAGFAMAAGDSPHWAQNVGKGAMVGIQDYNKSRDKMQELEEKRYDMAQKLAAADRAETIAAATYGANSAQADKAANEKRKLTMLSDKLNLQLKNETNRIAVQSGNLDAGLKREEIAARERQHRESVGATLEAAKITRGGANDAKLQAAYDRAEDNARAVVSERLKATGKEGMVTDAEFNQLLNAEFLLQLKKVGLAPMTGTPTDTAPAGPREKPLSSFFK